MYMYRGGKKTMRRRSSKAKRSMKMKKSKRSSKSRKTMRKTRKTKTKTKTKKGSIPRLEAALRHAIQKAGGQPAFTGGAPIV